MLIETPNIEPANFEGRAMAVLPVWLNCLECSRLPDCDDPFPPSDICSHPIDRVAVPTHTGEREPRFWKHYAECVVADNELKSFYLRWHMGKGILEADFLKIRDKAIAHGISPFPGPRWLIWEFLDYDLHDLHDDFQEYYSLKGEKAAWMLQAAFNGAIIAASPEHVMGTTAIGGDWHRYMIDITRMWLWGLLELGFLDLDHLDEESFRARFEQEWEKLLPYRGLHFDFRVVPKLSWNDFVRYQKLPNGKAVIRSSLSCYMTHQAFIYPHLLKTLSEKFTEVALLQRLREMYKPLIDKTAKQIQKNLHLEPHQTQERNDIRAEAEKTFEKALQEFDFNWRPGGKERVFGSYGIIGLTEDKSKRAEIDQLLEERGSSLRTQAAAIYVFAHYVQRRMHFWAQANYPPDQASLPIDSLDTGQSLSNDENGQLNNGQAIAEPNGSSLSEYYLEEEPDFSAPDGMHYIMIQKAARRYGLSEDQLRRMDRAGSFPALRAGDVLGSECPVGRNIRLYPCTPESDWIAEIAIGRAASRSSALGGKELNRSQAAKFLGIRERKLRHLEQSGKLKPRRKGSLVVYDAEILAQVAVILEKQAARVAQNKARR